MKNVIFYLSLLLVLPSMAEPSAEKIFFEHLKKSKMEKSHLGVLVSSGTAASHQMIISHNSTQKMIPASITKVITASAVLENFPPGTKFKTQLFFERKPTGRQYKGALFLKGGGDPSFVSENMWFLVNAFKRSGVDVIDGDIVVDDTLFDHVRFDESRESARVDRAYDAPVGAMSFNWNSINVYVRPSKKGEKAKVFLDPENEFTKLENKAKTVSGSKVNLEVQRKSIDKKDLITVSGTIGEDVLEHVIFKNVTQPEEWSGHQLKSFLSQRGIIVNGAVREGVMPSSAVLAAEAESKPIEDILGDMNKFSNNYVAEMLCKNLGLKKKQPSTIESGMQVIREHLQSLGIESKDYDLINPSGFTRDNRFTAQVLWRVLKHLQEDFRVQPEFIRSLPISGIDGTLKKRMKSSSAERWVRAKTGLLNNVVAMAGYAGQKDGTPLTFVFIYNGPQDEAKVRQFYDDLLIDLVK